MAEYDTDEERITAIMDFLKRNQRFILLTLGAVFFTAIISLSIAATTLIKMLKQQSYMMLGSLLHQMKKLT